MVGLSVDWIDVRESGLYDDLVTDLVSLRNLLLSFI